MFVSVDPGVQGCGVACWSGGELVAAGYVARGPALHGGAGDMARKVREYVALAGEPTGLAIEFPQAYHDRSRQKGDQNDLLHLAAVVGAVEDRMLCRATRYLPHAWKNTVPKDVMGRRIESRLSAAEKARISSSYPKSLLHNVLDAVGIGLKHLGRL